jgi:HEAT repeat protein
VFPPVKTFVWYFALAAVLSPAALSAQNGPAAPSQSDQLATSIARAKSGNGDTYDVEIIAEAGAVQAIPSLEEQFGRTTDVSTKTEIANGLVRLGDKHNTYWNYLLEQATLAVDSDVPDALFSDPLGKTVDQNSELQAWAQAHNVSANTAAQSALYDLPGKVFELADTGDPRGIPLLRRALQSRNYMMAVWAAKGLAQIQDKNSIPLIIAACQGAPTGFASEIAKSLIWFDDPRAQTAVDTYVPKEHAKIFRQARAQGMKPFGWQMMDPAP